MKRYGRILSAVAFLLGTGHAASAQDAAADTVVAVVGGEEILLGHMIALRRNLPAQYVHLPDETLFPVLLDQLIRQAALAQAAAPLSTAARLQLENQSRALAAAEHVEDLALLEVSEEEVRMAYDERYADYVPATEYDASHILVASEEEAAEIVAELREGADFAELALARSEGPSGVHGGGLGWFGKGAMVQEFEDAVAALEQGEISEPVQTDFGWHVIRLNDTRLSSPPDLDEARDDIVEEIVQLRLPDAIARVVDAADVSRPDLDGIDSSVLSDLSLIE